MNKFWMIMILFGAVCAWSQVETYRLLDSLNLKNKRVSPFENTIKMYDIAIDPVRSLAYTAGSMTEYVAVVDLKSGQQIGAFKHGWSHQLVNLSVNPYNGFVLVYAPQESIPAQHLVDPQTGAIVGRYVYAGASGGSLVFDDQLNRIFLADQNWIRVLNGETLEVISEFQVGNQKNAIGGMAFSRDHLFVGSRNLINGKAKVDVYDPDNPSKPIQSYSANSQEPLGTLFVDESANRLILAGKQDVKVLALNNGQVTQSFSAPEDTGDCDYSPLTEKFYQIRKEGWSDGGELSIWGKLFVTDIKTGVQTTSKTGEYTHRLAICDALQMVVWPCMHSGYLDAVDSETLEPLFRVDLGESIAGMALGYEDEGVFIVERLGGNQTYFYDSQTDSFTDFSSPYWPCAVSVDAELNKLFVLSHNESSVYAYDLATLDGPLSIRLTGMAPGVTDAIGTMVWDAGNKRGYASLPETEQIGVFDGISNELVDVFRIQGFKFDEKHHVAVGNIQLAVSAEQNRLFVLMKYEKVLQSYDLDTFSLMAQRDLSSSWPDQIGDLAADILVFDAFDNQVWVANNRFNPQTLSPLGTAPGDSRFIGYSPDKKRVYFLGQNQETGMLQIFERNPRSLAITQARDLYAIDFGCPVLAYDEFRERLWIGEFQNVNLRHYDLANIQSGDGLGHGYVEPPFDIP